MRSGDPPSRAPSTEDILRALALRRARSDSESSGGSAFSGGGVAVGRRGSGCRHSAINAAFARRTAPQPPPPLESQGLVRRAVATFAALFSLFLLPVYLIGMVILQRFWRAAR